jgi:hypothetical protein
MIRVCLLAILLLSPGWAEAAIAKVQSTSASGNNVTSVTTTAIATTTGNLLILDLSYWHATAGDQFSSVTDSGSHAWTLGWGPQADAETPPGRIRQYLNAAITGSASHTFTLTLTSAGFPTIAAKEVSGHAAAPLDQTAASTTTPANTSHTSAATPTTTQANELLAGLGASAAIAAYTIGGSFTQDENIATTATAEGLISGHRIVAATGAYTFAYTTDTSVTSAEGLGTYKEAAAAAGVPLRTLLGVGQ